MMGRQMDLRSGSDLHHPTETEYSTSTSTSITRHCCEEQQCRSDQSDWRPVGVKYAKHGIEDQIKHQLSP